MTQYPQFLAIDASSYEPDAYPVAISWSLSDGTIKSTLIQPDENWEGWDPGLEDLHGISQETLFQLGETGWEVIREFEFDCENPHFLVQDSERMMELLDTLYDAFGKEPPVELVPIKEWSEIQDTEQRYTAMEELRSELGLSPYSSEDNVRLMLEMWVRQQKTQL